MDLQAENVRLAHELAESLEREKALREAIDEQLAIHAAHVRQIQHEQALALSAAQQQAATERSRAEGLAKSLREVRSDRHRAQETQELRHV